MEASPHPALCCPGCTQNSINFAEFSLQKERPIMEASPHPDLCCPFVHRIVLTLPSSHSKEKDPSWKHPHTLLCVVRVVHKIVLTSLSSHFKEKDPSWKHPHTLLFVFPSGSPGSCFASSSVTATSTSPKEDKSCLEKSKIFGSSPLCPP